MRVLAQLLKEFWLPLILGGAWTAYNMAAVRGTQWTVRDAVNIFGPSFFFMSWLVAQWYRVRKQQRVEEGLTGIKADLRAMRSPLLPCGLFYTLKYECGEARLEKLFGRCDGWKKYGKPTDILRPVGFVKLNSAYNSIEFPVHESRCSLKHEAVRELGDTNEHVALLPVDVTVEFFFGKSKPSGQPALVLEASGQIGTVSRALEMELFDKTIFQDTMCRGLAVKNSLDHDWSTNDLRGSYLRVTMEFVWMTFQGRRLTDVTGWPALHNLQLVIGPNVNHLLAFNLKQLEQQIVRPTPEPFMKGDIECVQLLYGCHIDEVVYRNNLLVTADKEQGPQAAHA